MAVLKLTAFGGEVPVQGDRALPDAFATEAVNTWLYSQELRGIHPNINLQNILGTTRKVFRVPKGTSGGDPDVPGVVPPPSYLGDSTWLEFQDPDTDIIRGSLVEDSFKRFYFCSPSTGPMFNTLARLIVGDASYKLGVPQPSAPMGLSVVGGAAPSNVTRAYLYTWVNIYGEESGVSPPVTAAGKADGSWNLTALADPTTEFTGYAPYAKKIIYRTITAATGTTTYFKVAEVAPATTTYNDTLPDTTVASNLQLEASNFALPPSDLEGFVMMPNGFLIGWSDNDIYFSEPYRLHAWPVEYVESVEYPIVGMGVFGQTCAVMTEGFPAAITGVAPITCTLVKTTVQEPCLSRGGIVSTPDAVYYPSPNGLVGISAAGPQNLTQQLITREEWGRDFAPAYLRAARYQQGYLALRAVPNVAERTAFYLDLTDLRTAVSELSEFDGAVNVQQDVWSAEVFTLRTSKVFRHDPPTNFYLPYRWRSKEFQYLNDTNFGAYALFWDQQRFDDTSTDATDILAAHIPVHLKVWCDRRLVYNQNVPVARNGRSVRLPSGFKGSVWQVEITGRAPVYQLHVASTIKELRSA